MARSRRSCYFSSLPHRVGIGQFARLLLTVAMVAISQAPSPESNPNSPLPVTGLVVHYTTNSLIGGKFVQQRATRRYALLHDWPASTVLAARRNGRWFLFRPIAAHPTRRRGYPRRAKRSRLLRTCISSALTELSMGRCFHPRRWVDNKPFNEPYADLLSIQLLWHLHGLVLETSI